MNADVVVGSVGNDGTQINVRGVQWYLRGIITEELDVQRGIA